MKKTVSLLLAMLLTAALLAGSALAADALTMTVSSETAAAVGEEVTLSISLTSNPGLATLDFTLNYDESALKLEAMAFNTDFTAGGLPAVNTAGKQMTFIKQENTSYTGEIATATFTVLKAGTTTVSATIIDCLDVDENPVRGSVTAGTVKLPCITHAWDEGVETKAPDCENKGVRTYTCSACGETKTEDIDPIGHDWDEGKETVTPGCETKGVRTYTCGNDASHTKTEDIDPIGHDWDEGKETVAPGCETKGVRTYTCGNDASHTKTEDIDPLGHDWDEGEETKAATTTEKGEMLFTCRRDESHTKTEDIPALVPPTPAPAGNASAGDEIAKTGDDAQPVLWLMLVLVTGTAAMGIYILRRKKEN